MHASEAPALNPRLSSGADPAFSASGSAILLSELFPPDIGGSAELFANIYSRLRETRITVITNSARAGESGAVWAGRVVRVPMASNDWGLANFASLKRYARVIARLRSECRGGPAVVHCGRALPEGLAARLATHVGGRLQYLCWTHGEELKYARTSRELSSLLRWVHRGAAMLIANSHSTARELAALDVPAERVQVVHPGVDAGRFQAVTPQAQAIRACVAGPGDVLLLTVGRLQRRKGHDTAIEALAALRDQMPGLKYLIVGDGEERQRLERLVEDRQLVGRVTFAGTIGREVLPDYYAAADVFVHPNRLERCDVEGFGMVFLEAAAAGLPTIGGRSGGVPEAIDEGSTGLLVDGTSVHELMSAIRVLASSRDLRRRMGEAGSTRVRAEFSWQRAAAAVEAIHARVAHRAAPFQSRVS